jgi:hypothetical protein
MDTHLVVGIADTCEAREELYRFRVERGIRPRDTLLPDARLIDGGLRDDLDPLAALLRVVDTRSGEVVGTARTNFVGEGPLFLYSELYGLADMPLGRYFASTVTSGWTVAWEMRSLAVPTALARGVWELLSRERVSFDFLDCRDAERPFFERCGYQRLRTIAHPTRGHTHLMMLDVRDASRLYGHPA